MKLYLNWQKCVGDVWCNFEKLKLEHSVFNNAVGVYIIWSNSVTVKVGSGKIKDEIYKDRQNPHITAFPNLNITWCPVNLGNINGVKRYLIASLRPKVNEHQNFTEDYIQVNFPWV